ncbi:MAG: hypothetical protein P9M06_03690 [Candidatus Saelkia tenebricola]|nr:hypothetical protein [Candidatus Saelkia tenebricola]
MKTIFNDPVGWARKAVGSKSKFYLMISLHLFVGVFNIFFLIYLIGFQVFSYAFSLLLLITFFPVCYLYAMKQLLIKLQANEKNETQE